MVPLPAHCAGAQPSSTSGGADGQDTDAGAGCASSRFDTLDPPELKDTMTRQACVSSYVCSAVHADVTC